MVHKGGRECDDEEKRGDPISDSPDKRLKQKYFEQMFYCFASAMSISRRLDRSSSSGTGGGRSISHPKILRVLLNLHLFHFA